jgi:DNA mismatch repair protein MutS
MERIAGRISAGSASPRDVRALAAGLEKVPALKDLLADAEAALLRELVTGMEPLREVRERIESCIVPEPPNRLGDGHVIAEGVDPELDDLRLLRKDSRQWIANLEMKERQSTGISSLKIGYNKVFGYYIEISNAHASRVPEGYMRRQTLTNAERFITPELKEYEARILGAQDAIARMEARIFSGLLEFLVPWIVALKKTVSTVACLDVLHSHATLALDRGYGRPEVQDGRSVIIRGGRHPVVEQVLKEGEFVPNDCTFEGERDTIHVITGPNMAGKSTYMRQIASWQSLHRQGPLFRPGRSSWGSWTGSSPGSGHWTTSRRGRAPSWWR